jgi:RNA polymerase sigma-70 factor (ECF subfamily)
MSRLFQEPRYPIRVLREMPSDISLLLAEAKLGSEVARGALFEHHRSYLELLARVELGRRLKTKVDPSDIVQETFLEAHRSFESFRGEGEREFAAWLRTILARRITHLVRRYLRNQGRDVRREQMLDVALEHSSRALERGLDAVQPTPSQGASQREQGILLANALAQLPPDYREVVVLRHFEGLSFVEVGERMGRSLDSVQKLWVRALGRLRQELKE